jgi:transposase
MSNRRYSDEFKTEAVKQVTERGYPVQEVAKRLGVSTHSLYIWLRKAGGGRAAQKERVQDEAQREIARLRAELKRVEEERDILKKAAAYFAKESR